MRPPLTVLLLAGLLVTSGCLGFGGEPRPPSDQQAQDALNRTRTAMADVTSYRARARGTAVATRADQHETVAVSGQALVNLSARAVAATVHVQDRTRRTYVTGYTAYTECRLTGWGRQNLSKSRPWFEYTPIGEQLAVLAEAPVYWRGTERLNGTETAVIVAHPTEEELAAAPGLQTFRPTDPGDVGYHNATLTVWLSTETWRPRQIHEEINLRKDGASVTLTATWRFDEYNAPADAARPSFDESDIRPHGC